MARTVKSTWFVWDYGDEDDLNFPSRALFTHKHGAFHGVWDSQIFFFLGMERGKVAEIYRIDNLEGEHFILSGCFVIPAFYPSKLREVFLISWSKTRSVTLQHSSKKAYFLQKPICLTKFYPFT